MVALITATGCTVYPDPLMTEELTDVIADMESERAERPADLSLRLQLGDRYRRMGRIDEAEGEYRHVLEGARDRDAHLHACALEGLGRAARSRDDSQSAEAYFTSALAVADGAELRDLSNTLLVRLGTLERARADYVAACAWYVRAGSAEAAQHMRELGCGAKTELLQIRGAIQRARAAATPAERDAAAEEAKQLLDTAGNSATRGDIDLADLASALTDYSALNMARGDVTAAEAAARRAVELNPSDAMLKAYLLTPLVLLGRIEEADAAADDVISGSWPSNERQPYWPNNLLRRQCSALARSEPNRADLLAIIDRLEEHAKQLVEDRSTLLGR